VRTANLMLISVDRISHGDSGTA